MPTHVRFRPLAASVVMLALTTCGLGVAIRGPAVHDTPNPPVATSASVAAPAPVVAPAANPPVRPPMSTSTTASTTCGDDGSSGRRVELIYVRAASQPDRYHTYAETFQKMASQFDAAFVEASRRTGGVRHVRFVTDASCRPVVAQVAIGSPQIADVDLMTAALRAKGFDRIDRKYVVWYEHPGCGRAYGAPGDDRPGPSNGYNGGPNYAAVGTDCWTWHATAHELLHTLGAVQPSAPHATSNGHCWDDEDIMCYDDDGIPNPPGGLEVLCPAASENTIDCNGDDYFNVNPPKASYLATHWNVANSLYLTGTGA